MTVSWDHSGTGTNGVVRLTATTFKGNVAAQTGGGGAFTGKGPEGGAVSVREGEVWAENCVFSDNAAYNGLQGL